MSLTVKQHQAIGHLAAGETLVSTAAAVHVHEKTIRRWREQPAFAAALDAAVLDLTESHRTETRGMLVESLARVRAAITDPNNPGGAALAGRMLCSPHLTTWAFGAGEAGETRTRIEHGGQIDGFPAVSGPSVVLCFDDGEGEDPRPEPVHDAALV